MELPGRRTSVNPCDVFPVESEAFVRSPNMMLKRESNFGGPNEKFHAWSWSLSALQQFHAISVLRNIPEFIPALTTPRSDRISMLSPTISTTKPFPQSGNESLQVRNILRERVGFDIHLENDIPAKYVHILPFRATLVDLAAKNYYPPCKMAKNYDLIMASSALQAAWQPSTFVSKRKREYCMSCSPRVRKSARAMWSFMLDNDTPLPRPNSHFWQILGEGDGIGLADLDYCAELGWIVPSLIQCSMTTVSKLTTTMSRASLDFDTD